MAVTKRTQTSSPLLNIPHDILRFFNKASVRTSLYRNVTGLWIGMVCGVLLDTSVLEEYTAGISRLK